jgi:uncharacterized membrane protein
MPLIFMVFMTVGLIVAALVQCFGHLTFRQGVFFGATVDPDFPRSEDGQRILWRYRRPVIVMAAVCMTALWLVVPRLSGIAAPLTASGLLFIEVFGAVVSMASASKLARAFAKPRSPTQTRTVSLAPRERTLPGGWLPFLGPMLIVGAARLFILTKRELMPPETYRGALTLLLVAFVSNAFYMLVAWFVAFRRRQINPEGLAANEENADRRVAYWMRLVFAYVFSGAFVAMALAFAGITSPVRGARFGITLWVILWALWLALVVILMVYIVKRKRREAAVPSLGDTTPDECWKWGLFYYNPADPALVVESRAGRFGCDLNLGNKWSWILFAVILATPFLIRLLWH